MTAVYVKIEVIVLGSNDEKQHVSEVCSNTLTRRMNALGCRSIPQPIARTVLAAGPVSEKHA